jgi:hypothetical protein
MKREARYVLQSTRHHLPEDALQSAKDTVQWTRDALQGTRDALH